MDDIAAGTLGTPLRQLRDARPRGATGHLAGLFVDRGGRNGIVARVDANDHIVGWNGPIGLVFPPQAIKMFDRSGSPTEVDASHPVFERLISKPVRELGWDLPIAGHLYEHVEDGFEYQLELFAVL
jgi:hypothetical protein